MSHIKVRLITDADIPAAIDLLTGGYGSGRVPGPVRPRSFWEDIFSCLSHRPLPAEELPRYGYVIDSDGVLVGILLLIFSTVWDNGKAKIRCNGLGLYVDPAFRLCAPQLIKKASDFKEATVLNLTPAKNTFRMIEALSYVRYCDGIFASIPLLGRARKEARVKVVDVHTKLDVRLDPHDRDLLLEHADCGCMSLWCITPQDAYPFVFRIRQFNRVPCVHLVYCRNVDDFVRFARPIGLFLARHTWHILVLLDANGPVHGLVGKYFAGKANRYFRGSDRPRLGDLAYTEIALFDIGP
ncbi:acyl-CoA acyltransferase [Bradyrhizobium sp. SSUT77]|uniref:acyl-CoA acyltransferase n=1 Tax=Bradyrhizobium sp. SSUT77 TaxID=3040603 RepID=UPI002448E732|nr:acyl-CoA acyltransferase [Bradyrhizobium sp. SSUT77]MDH2347361.1 acyl-CoA acyltransferase [Bradyrhizobium sp. SSUT77]